MNHIKRVCVYSASSTKIDPLFVEAARELGVRLAGEGISLVNGGGKMGLMAAVSDGVLSAGGEAIGVIPRFMIDREWHHKGLSQLIEVDDMHARKQLMANMSDAIIALPGGCGTLEELLEVITWKQLGLYLHPIIILNIKGYFNLLIEMFERAVEEHFMGELHRSIWRVANSVDEAMELLYTTPEWDPSVRKFAAI